MIFYLIVYFPLHPTYYIFYNTLSHNTTNFFTFILVLYNKKMAKYIAYFVTINSKFKKNKLSTV